MNTYQCPSCKEHKGPKEFYSIADNNIICINCQVEKDFDKELSFAFFIEERNRLKKKLQAIENTISKM